MSWRPELGSQWSRRTTHEQRMAMRKRYEEDGESIASISRDVGLSRNAVFRALRDVGTTMRPPPAHLPHADRRNVGREPAISDDKSAEMRTWYEQEGLSVEQVAARAGEPTSTTYSALLRAGATMRSSGRRRTDSR